MHACMLQSLQSCPTLCDTVGQQPTRILCPQDSLGKNTGVGCHFLLQASRLLHPHSTVDKMSRLMLKQFSTARNMQRDSKSYREERREEGEGDRGDQVEKAESQKGKEQSSQ